jgi:hypothetical protein
MFRKTAQIYDQKFYLAHQEGVFNSARHVVPLLLDLIGMKSVCDVGCGVGEWLATFIENGVSDVLGLDGAYVDKKILRIPASKFRTTDLNQPFSVDRTFDVVTTLEVAEHLHPDRAPGFVRDLTALSSIVIFAAAVPGQGGIGHINEQWPDYWVKLFKERNYICVDVIRPKIWENKAIIPWYRQNMLVFCDNRALERFSKLRENQNWMVPLRVIHPDQFTHQLDRLINYPGTKFLLKSLPRALRRSVERWVKN